MLTSKNLRNRIKCRINGRVEEVIRVGNANKTVLSLNGKGDGNYR